MVVMHKVRHNLAIMASIFVVGISAPSECMCQAAASDDTVATGLTGISTQAKNTIYAEVATMLFVGGVSLNYERMIKDNFALRTGLGAGYSGGGRGSSTSTAIGTMVMLVYMTSGSDYRLEAGLGTSLLYFDSGFSGGDFMGGVTDGGISTMPAIALGYRYQQHDGGFFFRVGISYTYFMSTPVQFSFGHTF